MEEHKFNETCPEHDLHVNHHEFHFITQLFINVIMTGAIIFINIPMRNFLLIRVDLHNRTLP